MHKTIKNFLNTSIIISVLFILVGILFIVFPASSLDVLRWIIAIFFMGAGAGLLATELTNSRLPFFGNTILGVILLIAGIIFAANPGVMDIFPIILGAWFIVSAVSSLKFAASLSGSAGLISVISASVSVIVGIILIINPWSGSVAMTVFAGIMMLIYALSSLIDLITLKRNVQDLSKKFNKFIAEGEVVEKKQKKK